MALALLALGADDRRRPWRRRSTVPVAAVVVVDVDGRAGQRLAGSRRRSPRSPLPHCSRAEARRFSAIAGWQLIPLVRLPPAIEGKQSRDTLVQTRGGDVEQAEVGRGSVEPPWVTGRDDECVGRPTSCCRGSRASPSHRGRSRTPARRRDRRKKDRRAAAAACAPPPDRWSRPPALSPGLRRRRRASRECRLRHGGGSAGHRRCAVVTAVRKLQLMVGEGLVEGRARRPRSPPGPAELSSTRWRI